MRCILGLCVVLAVGNSAWTSEMSRIAGEPEYQTPAATVTSPVTQSTVTPALPAMSPAGAYQTATGQPATTSMSPAPTTMSPGTYTTGTQPVATYATPMPNTTYTTTAYPTTMGGGFYTARFASLFLSRDASRRDLWHTRPDLLHRHAWPDLLPACSAQVWPLPAVAAASHAGLQCDAGLWNSGLLDTRLPGHNLCGACLHLVRLQQARVLRDDLCTSGGDLCGACLQLVRL